MRVEFGETDECSTEDGKAHNIIITIEGKRMIIPTDKTIAELCELIKKMPLVVPSKFMEAEEAFKPEPGIQIIERHNIGVMNIRTNEIEREDLVKCTKVNSTDLQGVAGPDREIVQGGIYRVLKISMSNGIVNFYDIIDDNAAVPRRLQVYPNEVELYKKHGPREIKTLVYEERVTCGFCNEENVLALDKEKNRYIGVCVKCSKFMEKERPVAKPVN